MVRAVVFLVALTGVFLAHAAWADEVPDGEFIQCEAPCPGWHYDLVYQVGDGKVIMVAGFASEGPSVNLRDGQATMDVTSYPQLKDLRSRVDDFRVDVVTGEIVDSKLQGGLVPGGSGVLGLAATIGVTLIALAVATLMVRRSRVRS